MRFDEWLSAIERRGSAYDPIFYKGVATTPLVLSYEFGESDSIRGICIEYRAKKG